MKVFKGIGAIRNRVHKLRTEGKSTGLVPTMGSLHDGHLELVKNCKKQNDITISSIYVNPTQFNDKIDLENYPRPLDKDLDLLRTSGCDIVFVPDDKEMYSDTPVVKFDFGQLDKILEGKFRPGHFNGVGLAVAKLLNIIQPDRAYFGEKDLQQLLVIRQLVRDLNFGTEIVGVPTVREASGLAMSSRNERLNANQRHQAALIYEVLNKCRESIINDADIERVREVARTLFAQNPEVKPEYLEIVDLDNFEILKDLKRAGKIAICTAVYIAKVRLIDNIILEIGK